MKETRIDEKAIMDKELFRGIPTRDNVNAKPGTDVYLEIKGQQAIVWSPIGTQLQSIRTPEHQSQAYFQAMNWCNEKGFEATKVVTDGKEGIPAMPEMLRR